MEIRLSLFILFFFTLLSFHGHTQTILNSKHNLSISGLPGGVISSTETEVCIFCHTPHNSNAQAPLWNRNSSTVVYTLYDKTISSSLNATPGQPDGASILCLSCHDGTIALGEVNSRASDIFDGAGGKMPLSSGANLGIDLSNNHPVSFTYDAALASADGGLKFPPDYPANVDGNSKLQCTSCHDPHDNINGSFLLASNLNSGLCISCHDKNLWSASSHNTSTATWNNSGTDPWSHIQSPYSSVADNACSNCHSTHNAPGNAQILKSNLEEDNCLDCHNGNVAQTDIASQLIKTFKHDVAGYNGIHQPDDGISFPTHVECTDCHNPHAANGTSANAPNANGALAGVSGIDQNGNLITTILYEYQLCFRCHADNPVTGANTTRVIEQTNTRFEFATGAVSFHPVEIQGKNSYVPGLIPPLTESSMIYCTDCHASNGTSPAGPHGSIYPNILKLNYETADYTTESAQAYELCYSCHLRSEYTTDSGDEVRRDVHYTHVVEEDAPCNACHDPHGISDLQGNPTNNSHLINFDVDIVGGIQGRAPWFQDDGYRAGRCSLRCHNKGHNRKSYN